MEICVICFYFVIQSAFMNASNSHLDTIKDIKQMMERSSRFISLSGLSGIAAGISALVGAWFAYGVIHPAESSGHQYRLEYSEMKGGDISIRDFMGSRLFEIALFTLIAALVFAFLFTWLRSKKTNVPLWGITARRLMWNVSIPLGAGGLYILRLIETGTYHLIAPGCLIFYGLALVNASKYTLAEIRYLGYAQLVVGLINLWVLGYGLYFWATGFGVLHIVYGIYMWFKYERND